MAIMKISNLHPHFFFIVLPVGDTINHYPGHNEFFQPAGFV
jgi:hypothetical protein